MARNKILKEGQGAWNTRVNAGREDSEERNFVTSPESHTLGIFMELCKAKVTPKDNS